MAADGSIKIDTSIDGSGFQSGLSKLGGMAAKSIAAAGAALGGLAAIAIKTLLDIAGANKISVKRILGHSIGDVTKRYLTCVLRIEKCGFKESL